MNAAGSFPLWTLSHFGTTEWVLLELAAALAVLDWIAVGGPAGAHRLEYVAKPATLAVLVALAVVLTPVVPSERAVFVAALGFCLAGDVFLMLPGDRTEAFGAGLGSFLVAQILFTVAMTRTDPDLARALVAFGVLVVIAGGPAGLVLRAVRRSDRPWLVWPVVVYIGAVLAMASTAWSGALSGFPFGQNPLLAAGASAFVISDTTLAFDRFVRPLPRGTLAVHVTYHVAIGLLVLSLAGTALASGHVSF